MQGPRSVPPHDRLTNRTNDCVPVTLTQDGAGAQPEDKEPAAPLPARVAAPPPTAELRTAEQLQRLARLTEGGNLPKLHEHNNWGGQERFAGSLRWLDDKLLLLVRDKADQSVHYKETMQWMREVIMCFNDLGYRFDIGLTGLCPLSDLKERTMGMALALTSQCMDSSKRTARNLQGK